MHEAFHGRRIALARRLLRKHRYGEYAGCRPMLRHVPPRRLITEQAES
ncbi:hypothetical protein ABZX95_46085 [Streptomyces sp. NPDC004232]